jgi:NADP-dependent 3-hydroxy acid dehydrogenase YdfG
MAAAMRYQPISAEDRCDAIVRTSPAKTWATHSAGARNSALGTGHWELGTGNRELRYDARMTYSANLRRDGARPVAVVTGASAGIGAATARLLAASGFDLVLGARRLDRIEALATEIGGRALALDVRDRASVEAFAATLPVCNVLVNNAGGAHGLEPLAQADDAHWREMWETNVFGLMLMTRAMLPALEASGAGHIVNIGSIAGLESYPGGSGYTSAKHGVVAITETLRLELLGKPIRITEVDPGMVETEFSVVRFGGDTARAAKVYEGVTPLVAEDIADIITWAVTRPPHVNIDHLRVTPLAQANATTVHRR